MTLAALEPVLLRGAYRRARDLPAERRAPVRELHRAARRRALAARDHREPEQLPVALTLGREALLLSMAALQAARGAPEGALAPAASWQMLQEVHPDGSEDLRSLLTSQEPAFPDRLSLEARRRLIEELEHAISAVEGSYEARTPREVTLTAVLRVALVLTSAIASLVLLLAVTNPP